MDKSTNPAKVVAVVIAVVVAIALAFLSYQRFMAPKKSPAWTPPANYGAPVPYGAPATPR